MGFSLIWQYHGAREPLVAERVAADVTMFMEPAGTMLSADLLSKCKTLDTIKGQEQVTISQAQYFFTCRNKLQGTVLKIEVSKSHDEASTKSMRMVWYFGF